MKSSNTPITLNRILRTFFGEKLFIFLVCLGQLVATLMLIATLLSLNGCAHSASYADSPLKSYKCISYLSCA